MKSASHSWFLDYLLFNPHVDDIQDVLMKLLTVTNEKFEFRIKKKIISYVGIIIVLLRYEIDPELHHLSASSQFSPKNNNRYTYTYV